MSWIKSLFAFRDGVRRELEDAERERLFGEKAEFVRQHLCAVGGIDLPHRCEYRRRDDIGFHSDPAHVEHTVGAGGDSTHLIPLCRFHHRQQHALGIRTFEQRYAIDLAQLAEHYEKSWQLTLHEENKK